MTRRSKTPMKAEDPRVLPSRPAAGNVPPPFDHLNDPWPAGQRQESTPRDSGRRTLLSVSTRHAEIGEGRPLHVPQSLSQ